jgi:predicted GNAT family N-acyltransferase
VAHEQINFETRIFDSSSPDYEKSLAIRKEVFIREQEIDPELELEFENDCLYFLTFLNGAPVATGRLREKGDKIKFERVATLRDHRKKGAAAHLMQSMFQEARSRWPQHQPYMHAQLEAAQFYQKVGWIRVGEVFDEAGIPHVAMTKYR